MPLIPAPSATEIRTRQMSNPKKTTEKKIKGGVGGLVGGSGCSDTGTNPAKHTPVPLKAAALTGNSNKWPQLHLSHNLPCHRTSCWYERCYFSLMWLHVNSHAAMTEISVPAFRVYCHPRRVLFLRPCAYTATNWRHVRFKPMLLMGKNVWYVLALSPFYIWPSVVRAAAPPDPSAYVPIKHLSPVRIDCLNSRAPSLR